MNENYNYTEYNEEKNRIPWKRILLIFLMLVVVVIIALLLLRGCGKKDLNQTLLEAGKSYYEKYPSELPTEAGQCFTVDLSKLKEENLIEKPAQFETCDSPETHVKVCLLESKNYHYVAILSCGDEKTNFGMWTDGTEENIVADKSDVRFKFLGQELNTGTKYYYPNNLTDIEKVKEYYASSPSQEYNGKEDSQTGYKWYTQSNTTVYWNNGEYSSTQPDGYTNKGDSTTKSYFTQTKPENASYRVIDESQNLYRYKLIARPLYYWCYPSEADKNNIKKSSLPCMGDFPKTAKIDYTCDGKTYEGIERGQLCSDYTEWTTTACATKVTTGVVCENVTGYKYTDTMWKWYKTGTVKKYYPSGSSSADKENTYYLSAPTNGAIKDEATKANVSKYFKLVKDGNISDKQEWLDVTSGFVTEDELFKAFKEKGYEVNSLSDIKKIETIRYQLQLQYRNVEK